MFWEGAHSDVDMDVNEYLLNRISSSLYLVLLNYSRIGDIFTQC